LTNNEATFTAFHDCMETGTILLMTLGDKWK